MQKQCYYLGTYFRGMIGSTCGYKIKEEKQCYYLGTYFRGMIGSTRGYKSKEETVTTFTCSLPAKSKREFIDLKIHIDQGLSPR